MAGERSITMEEYTKGVLPGDFSLTTLVLRKRKLRTPIDRSIGRQVSYLQFWFWEQLWSSGPF